MFECFSQPDCWGKHGANWLRWMRVLQGSAAGTKARVRPRQERNTRNKKHDGSLLVIIFGRRDAFFLPKKEVIEKENQENLFCLTPQIDLSQIGIMHY